MRNPHKREPAGPPESRSGPTWRPEPEGNGTPDLFALVRVVDEDSLGQRLLQLGADLYCEGTLATHSERLRHVIVREQFSTVVCGRDPGGKVETVAQAFERVCGEPLAAKKVRKEVPRGTKTDATILQTSKVTP